jgi:hypothetical protein
MLQKTGVMLLTAVIGFSCAQSSAQEKCAVTYGAGKNTFSLATGSRGNWDC